MNVVIFSPSWPKRMNANGIVTYCDNMVVSLRSQGHTVFVLSASRGGAVEKEEQCFFLDGYRPTLFQKMWAKVGEFFSAGFKQYYFGACAILNGIREIEKIVKIDIFEIEESFGWHYLIQKKVGFAVVMRLHGPHFINGTMGNKNLSKIDLQRFKREGRAFHAASCVSAPCHWVMNATQKEYSVNWPVKEVFFNPIQALPKEECWSSRSYTDKQILFVGRFDTHKGGDIVIEAFSRLLEKEPDARLIFAGPDRGVEQVSGGSLNIESAIIKYIPKDKLGSVNYIGLADADTICQLRRESHLTIMASRNENFPYSVLESLASAAPIIAARVGGVAEVFKHEESGLFFHGSDIESLVENIVWLLNDQELLVRLSENAYSRCLNIFSPEIIANQAVEFYLAAICHHDK